MLLWIHGEYTYECNGSLILTPYSDGYQQIEDPCAPVSNMIQTFDTVQLMSSWQIFIDPVDGPKLHLFQFDGTPVAPQFLVSRQPNMLPTVDLLNVTDTTSQPSQPTKRGLFARSAGERSQAWSVGSMLVLMASTLLASFAVVLF